LLGTGFPAHQDAPAYVAFNQKLHMTMMIAADPMTVENGCLEVVREQHEKGTFPMKPADGSMTDDVVNSMKWEPVVTKAGAVMVFSSFIPHRSGPNSSKHSRRAYYLTFNGASLFLFLSLPRFPFFVFSLEFVQFHFVHFCCC